MNATTIFIDDALPGHTLGIFDHENGQRYVGLYKDAAPILTVDLPALAQLVEKLALFQKLAIQVPLIPPVVDTPPTPVEDATEPEEESTYTPVGTYLVPEDEDETERLDKEDPTASYLLDPEEL